MTASRPLLMLQGIPPEDLALRVPALSLADARRIVSAVHRGRDWTTTRGVRAERLRALCEVARAGALVVRADRASALDPFRKLVLETEDGRRLETVRIPLERPGRYSACVSSQVGCALACTFCATGRLGLLRNLEAWEIVEQVRLVSLGLDRRRGERVHGVVFQGMGEPLANLDAVLAAIRVLREPSALAVDARAVTVCTAGIPAGVVRLAREAPKVRLALSIGSARPEVRRRLMPIDRAHPLGEVLEAAAEHARLTRHAPLWAMTLLAGINDSTAEAAALAELALSFAARAGVRPRLSIVPYNSISAGGAEPFERSPPEREVAFRDALRERGVFTHKRYSGGSDVGAACGQLAGIGYPPHTAARES
jgi:23S rRNA (adenine2503-C2)-methyltransferase